MAVTVTYTESIHGQCEGCATQVIPKDMFYLEGTLIVARWSCDCVTYDESLIKSTEEAIAILNKMGELAPKGI